MQRAQTMTTLAGGCRDPVKASKIQPEKGRRAIETVDENGLTRAGFGRGCVAVAVAVAWV